MTEQERIMPIKLGGSDNPDNLQILCSFHNIQKGAKHPDEWRKFLKKVV